jgi:lipoxygenase homology domain-containing protein 1
MVKICGTWFQRRFACTWLVHVAAYIHESMLCSQQCFVLLIRQDVVISSPGMPDQQFLANRWLATNEGDGQTYCVLYPANTLPGGVSIQPKKYRIIVYTSDIRGAGTDARVYCTLFGSHSGLDSGKMLLEDSKNNFERGMEDVFFVTAPDLGQLTEVVIEHDNSGPAPSWHCEQVRNDMPHGNLQT